MAYLMIDELNADMKKSLDCGNFVLTIVFEGDAEEIAKIWRLFAVFKPTEVKDESLLIPSE
jgi:hypothetical protein